MKAIDRLYQYFDFKGIKPTRFEKNNGLSNGYLGIQLKRNADIGSSILEMVINNCRDLNPEWLITGNGEMIKKQVVESESSCQVKNCDFMALIEKKDKQMLEMSQEIGKLKQELATLKKGGSFTPYNYAAEP